MEKVILWGNMIYQNGWFIYIENNENISVMTRQDARQIERDFIYNSAYMDLTKGGIDTFAGRGFVKEGYNYIYKGKYQVDLLGNEESDIIISESLNIPSRVNGLNINSVRKNSFQNLKIKSLYLPDSIKKIGNNAFADCSNLSEVIMGGKVIIEDGAFENTPFLKNKFNL